MIFRNPLKLLFYLCLLVVFLLVGYKTYLNLFTEDFEGIQTQQVEQIYRELEPGESFSFAVVGNINNSVGVFEDRIIPELNRSGSIFWSRRVMQSAAVAKTSTAPSTALWVIWRFPTC